MITVHLCEICGRICDSSINALLCSLVDTSLAPSPSDMWPEFSEKEMDCGS